MPTYPFPTTFDNTMLSAARKCPQAFVWAHMATLAPVETSVHLHAGAAYARGLEVARKAFFIKNHSLEDSIAIGGLALIKDYGDFSAPHNSAKTLDGLLGAYGHYFTQWPMEQGPRPAVIGTSTAIEWNFVLPIPGVKHPETGEDLVYCGRFDTIDDYNGMKMGGDDKTTTQLGEQWFNRWRLSNQITGYCWGAGEYGIPLAGFRLRGVSILKNSYGHAEAITYRKAWQIKEFLINTQATINHLITMWAAGYYEKAWNDACSSYGGCPFMILCESQQPEQWIPVNFTQRKWDPLASRD
jgi:hypothetical protein